MNKLFSKDSKQTSWKNLNSKTASIAFPDYFLREKIKLIKNTTMATIFTIMEPNGTPRVWNKVKLKYIDLQFSQSLKNEEEELKSLT